MIVVGLFLAVPWACLKFVMVVFPDHTHLLFLLSNSFLLCPFMYLLCLTGNYIVNVEIACFVHVPFCIPHMFNHTVYAQIRNCLCIYEIYKLSFGFVIV